MASIYARGEVWWCRLKREGKWICCSTKTSNEVEAREYADAAQAAIDRKESGGAALGPLTVRAYSATWLVQRCAADHDWKHDRGKLDIHVLPAIGDMLIAEVRTRHIADLMAKIRATPLGTTGERPSQRYVYNIYAVVSALFRDATIADKVRQTPCCLDANQLGPVVDKDPEWRPGAVFARGEVETLISAPAIPPDRHVVYGLGFLAGVRPGECSGLRWRHYDPMRQPLGQLTVAHSYNTRLNAEKSTKTNAVRYVPVHPTLAAMLAAWKLGGWAELVGRAPEPDDLIVPLPPSYAQRRRSRAGEPFRGTDYSGKRWREDLTALALRHRRGYDSRATFITLALEDGADPHVIETRVTHTKATGSRSAFAGYNRGLQWETTCREVAKLKIARRLATALATVGVVTDDEYGGGEGSRRPAQRHDKALAPRDAKEIHVVGTNAGDAGERSRADRVASLATALAEAVRGGDELGARRLAGEVLALLGRERRSA